MLATRRRSAAEKLALRAASLTVLDAWEQSGNLCPVMQAFYSGVDGHAQEQRRKLIYPRMHLFLL
ncbi:hypothetical protein PR003_g21881 [Phytophthora rubi]|uniref:Uncharacterized protein n=1 Tax=Phytophthora rubi TaxID=129364 RepID=A0A6A3IJQ1_9STRA|nr:hypothetical protein PR002_g23581 [Phytophthora rubi]KAE8986969.1 hypothetical protein PR001_g22455 [Phytophthora rubi]KAE9303933.1 hypothetical protein PR003_g21881 [Phytophthora rubi]